MRNKARLLVLLTAILFLCIGAIGLSRQITAKYRESKEIIVTFYEEGEEPKSVVQNGKVIVLDAGHGGRDPGKLGVTGAIEKEINLQIVYKLKNMLEEEGFQVVLTRTSDDALYSENASNKKMDDMLKRVAVIEGANAFCTISIHQNSYTSASAKGAQAFYYKSSAQSKSLAEEIQKSLKTTIEDGNKREAKPNSNYFLLTRTTGPIVILECGFLSNPEEEKLLTTDEYQELIALAIVNGIKNYDSLTTGTTAP